MSFKINPDPLVPGRIEIEQIEERRDAQRRFEKMYTACLRTIGHYDWPLSRRLKIYAAQVRALLRCI